MSKIGDLIVKLRLEGKDYQKGLRNAEAKTKGFAGSFGKIMGGIKMGWAAIGVAVAAVGANMIKSTNKLGDAWNRQMTGMKSAWQTFKSAVASWDFKDLGKNMKGSYESGKELAKVLDGMFEVENAIRLQKSAAATTLEEYRQDLMDTNLSEEKRIAAGNKYLNFLKKQADTEIEMRRRVRDAVIKNWLSVSGVSASTSSVIDFFSSYTGEGSAAASKYGNLAYAYEEKHNDQTNGAVVDAIYNYNSAMSAWSEENRRIIHQIRELNGALADEADILGRFNSIFKDVELTMEELDFSDWISDANDMTVDGGGLLGDEFVEDWEEKVARFQEIAAEFRDACINGFADGAQYMADALFGLEELNGGQLLANLLTPLADMAIREGEILMAQGIGVEACKTALESLDGAPAIAAGAALVAIGATAKSGLQKLASKGSTSTGTTSYGNSSTVSEAIQTEMTVYVTGRLSGSDILIAGQRAQKALAR